jgi:predicted nucleic acid-binding protein
MIIVSDTSPINYLILIGQIDLLPQLFEQIIILQAVYNELSDSLAPLPFQTWTVDTRIMYNMIQVLIKQVKENHLFQ